MGQTNKSLEQASQRKTDQTKRAQDSTHERKASDRDLIPLQTFTTTRITILRGNIAYYSQNKRRN